MSRSRFTVTPGDHYAAEIDAIKNSFINPDHTQTAIIYDALASCAQRNGMPFGLAQRYQEEAAINWELARLAGERK